VVFVSCVVSIIAHTPAASSLPLSVDPPQVNLTFFKLSWYSSTNVSSLGCRVLMDGETNMHKSSAFTVAVCVLVFVAVHSESHGQQAPVEKSIHMVEMRDETRLATDVYVPEGEGRSA